MRTAIPTLLVLASIGLFACGDEAPVPLPRAATGSAPAEATFVADPGGGPRVFLRASELARDRLVLEVVAQASGALHGASFRLTFDPAVVTWAGFAPAALFGGTDVVLAKEAKPGLVLLALSKLGAATPVDLDGGERVLGAVTFVRAAAGQSPIEWSAARSRLADPEGRTIEVALLGGTVTFP